MSTIASEIARSNDVFIKHNFDNHDGEVPVWAVVEVLSFGTLSKIIKNLKTGPGSSFAVLAKKYKYISMKGNLATPSQKMFTSWVQAVAVLHIPLRKFLGWIRLLQRQHIMAYTKCCWQ